MDYFYPMKKYFIHTLLSLAILFLFSYASCQKEACEGAICTEMFAMITVKIKDNSGNYIKPDKVTLQFESTNATVEVSQMALDPEVVVIDDGSVTLLKNRKDNFIFTAYKNNQVICTEKFILGADCCHVYKESGKDVIYLP